MRVNISWIVALGLFGCGSGSSTTPPPVVPVATASATASNAESTNPPESPTTSASASAALPAIDIAPPSQVACKLTFDANQSYRAKFVLRTGVDASEFATAEAWNEAT